MSKDSKTPTALAAADMAHAHQAARLGVPSVREYLYDEGNAWKSHDRVVKTLAADPLFEKTETPFMTRQELFERVLAMTDRIYELEDKHGWTPEETSIAISLLDDGTPLTLHHTAFAPVFNIQASPALLEKYGELIKHRGILGCYLQTELGHGSNVGRLETTATYVPSTREFEIHSPTLTSRKWWIGALGKVATHGVVQAKLILPNGTDVGPHLFFIQLRSLVDHKVLPGITLGDIGPKAMGGWGSTDNGYAVFNHVRIPHENMLSKFAQVTEDGQYIKPPHAKIAYGGMMYIRSGMVTSAGWALAKAATSSIRYATVRRQGNVSPNGLEQQVLTYTSTYYRLLPILARAYVFIQLGRQLTHAFAQTAAQLAKGDTSTLAEMHATTSGLKAFVTTATARDIEMARRSMGGHGFSAFAGLGQNYIQYLPNATFEGDNFVLDHQVVRAALKAYRSFRSNSTTTKIALTPSSSYLRLLDVSLPGAQPWSDPAYLALLLEHRAARVVEAHATSSTPDAGGAHRVAEAVTDSFVGVQVVEMIKGLGATALRNESQKIVGRLYTLDLLTAVEAALVDIFAFGLVPVPSSSSGPATDPAHGLRAAISETLADLLPDAIGLSDAFGLTDWELNSALGVYDGKVYEALVERAQSEPMNGHEVSPAYEKSIRPILLRGQRRVARAGAAAKL
ncbi:peroxisomal oxidase [Amylostereum chailletii]|nr:peroxisomal oxidase [Amylostereum chailletii]